MKFRIVRHFKDELYIYLGEAKHAETGETLTVYADARGDLYVRPSESFWDKENGEARFKPISPTPEKIEDRIAEEIAKDIMERFEINDPSIQFDFVDNFREIIQEHLSPFLKPREEDKEYRTNLDVPMEMLAWEVLKPEDDPKSDAQIIEMAVEEIQRLRKKVEELERITGNYVL